MICKNCNYILSGNESFCPDCGTPCEKDRTAKEQSDPQVIFTPDNDTSSPVFSQEMPPSHQKKKEKKSRAGLYLVIVLCAVILGTVAVSLTDTINFTPAIASLFSSGEDETTAESTTSLTEYDPLSGIISPAVSYKTTIGYINGESGQALRKGPDNFYGQIDLLPVSTIVHIIGSESAGSEWVYVYAPEKDIYGWLSSSYISSSLSGIDEEESEIYEETESTSPSTSAQDTNE